MTIEALASLGANTAEGLARCMNNEAFYLRMVGMALNDKGYDQFAESVAAGNLDAAFEAAHALKGVMANLSLTPILDDVSEITELLRNRTQMDYGPLVDKILKKRDQFAALL